MIITCPHCKARYKVKDGLIQTKGKKVKCKNCSAVFIAYPDKDSVLDRAPSPADSPVKKAATAAAGASVTRASASAASAGPGAEQGEGEENNSQATVKVDRSKLDQYLKRNAGHGGEEGELGASTVKVERDQFQKFLDQNQKEGAASPATVQVDRSQIDAFLKGAGGEGPAPPGDGATIKVDRSQLDAALGKGSAPTEPQSTPSMEATPPPEPELPQATAPADADGLPDIPDFSDFDDGGAADRAASQPSEAAHLKKPSDHPPAFADPSESPASAEAPVAEWDAVGTAPVEGSPETETPPEAGPNPEKVMFSEEGGEPETPSAAEKSYTARVDGVDYPGQNLATLRRWIEEGRLFEEDLVALEGADDFKRADEFPEIVPIFIEYYGSQGDAEPEAEHTQKKRGLFGWLGGLFKRS